MKRWIGSLAFACVAASALAQAPFTIARPADESRVREKVRVLIPKGSIPTGGYVGFFLDGNLLEATVPPLQGKYYVYTLDTKGRGITDGKHRLEAKLYLDYKEEPRIVDTSSVDITVANVSSIRVPNSGLPIKYVFRPGTQWIYTLLQRTTLFQITEQQQRSGGRAAELPVEFEKFRMLYAVDNVVNGNGLIRMQALPLKGKDYADITPTGATAPQRYYQTQMAPIYMMMRPNGTQVFGSIPPYIPMEGSSGGGDRTDLFAAFPLPSLPGTTKRPGDTWPSRFQSGRIDLEKLNEVTSVVRTFPARGEFIGVEWEMGRPCAKIRNVIDVGAKSIEGAKLTNDETADDKLAVNETIWYALDTKQVIKIIRDVTLEVREQQGGMGGFGGPSGFGPPAGFGGGGPSMPTSSGRGGGGAGAFKQHGNGAPSLGETNRQVPPGGRPGGFPPGAGGYPGGPGGYPGGPGGYPGGPGMGQGRPGTPGMGAPGMGFPGAGRGMGAGSGNQTVFTKLRIQYVFTLE